MLGGQPFPSPGDLPDPGIKPTSVLQVDFFTIDPPGKPETHRHVWEKSHLKKR